MARKPNFAKVNMFIFNKVFKTKNYQKAGLAATRKKKLAKRSQFL
jgi:hypothetical protein